ncbi:MAG: hypothetical protein WAO76_08815, partial [Georgfuchsia sp.]
VRVDANYRAGYRFGNIDRGVPDLGIDGTAPYRQPAHLPPSQFFDRHACVYLLLWGFFQQHPVVAALAANPIGLYGILVRPGDGADGNISDSPNASDGEIRPTFRIAHDGDGGIADIRMDVLYAQPFQSRCRL